MLREKYLCIILVDGSADRGGQIMKVKVGDRIYDGEQEPVISSMIILTDKEKEAMVKNFINIVEARKYCVYPKTEEWNKDNYKKIKEWMEI